MNRNVDSEFVLNNYEILSNGNIIRICLKGLRSFEKLIGLWDGIIKLILDLHKNCLIEDNMEGKIDVIEIFKLVKFINSSGFDHHIKTSIILNNSQAYDTDFFDTVSANRGYQIRHFSSEKETLDWLEKS